MASQRAPLKLATEYGLERDITLSPSQLINMYALPNQETTQGFFLSPASGFENPIEINAENIRSQFVFNGIQYVVSFDEVYSVDSLNVPTFLGTLNTTGGYVKATANETQVIWVDGSDAYIWNTLTSTFSVVTFGFSLFPGDVTMIDNYFVIPDIGATKFYVSALNDGTTWSALSFALFQSTPDQLKGISTLKRRVYLFGNYSTETWYDAGDSDFPLRRDNNSLFEHGIASPETVQEGFEIMMYLAQNKDGAAGVMLVEGTAFPRKVSSPSLDLYLQNVSNLNDASAILYKENGYTFYQLTFNADNHTFLYVVETNKWSEISMPNGDRSPIATHAFFNNKHYVGMFDEGKLYEFSYKFFTYRDELIRCQIVNPPLLDSEHRRVRADRYELEVVTGMPQGTLSNQNAYQQLNDLITTNTAPYALLFVSRNSGRTYGNGRAASIGKLGQYNTRVIWRKLGCMWARRMVLKIEFPFLVPFIVMGSYIIYEDLPE